MVAIDGRQARTLWTGLGLGSLAIFSGVVLLLVTGLREEALRDGLRVKAESVIETVYHEGGREAAKTTTDGAFLLCVRAQQAFVAYGVLTLVLTTVGLIFGRNLATLRLGTIFIGIGAILHPAHLLVAGWLAPSLGSTALAIDRVQWLAQVGAWSLVGGSLFVMCDLMVSAWQCRNRKSSQPATLNSLVSERL